MSPPYSRPPCSPYYPYYSPPHSPSPPPQNPFHHLHHHLKLKSTTTTYNNFTSTSIYPIIYNQSPPPPAITSYESIQIEEPGYGAADAGGDPPSEPDSVLVSHGYLDLNLNLVLYFTYLDFNLE
ncbi:hypothetical protein V8G54_009615 [Vigna mungo]|uniref:Uncharacterized protein n=1 Tax=Vigna mungo TaxID=3915 RepID=A0AAQ3NW45_VIGMU